MDISKFTKQFKFMPERILMMGVERESFLEDRHRNIVPKSKNLLSLLGDDPRFGYELSACQFEDRVGPANLEDLGEELMRNDRDILVATQKLGLYRSHYEVASSKMPLDVFSDPTGRYQEITKNMSEDILLAACRVIGTHVHVGMPDYETAIRVYNRVIDYTEILCALGDNSKGERLKIYKQMAKDFTPPKYDNWNDFYKKSIEKGFVSDPRSCWHFIRISVHGTIEFRMFGTTEDIDRVLTWASVCHGLCREAI